MGKPVVLIHFLPLEQYPPVMNLINFIADREQGDLVVLTTSKGDKAVRPFFAKTDRVKIRRCGKSDKGASPVIRYYHYLKFYSFCIYKLIKLRPDKVMYYDILSSFPAYVYWKYINRGAQIYIHYHEYTSPDEYRTGMKLSRFFHRLEKEIYPRVNWLSHTNEQRLKMFCEDEGLSSSERFFVMPNYPGRKWYREGRIKDKGFPKAIVYAGAVSRQTMYFEDFVYWVQSMNGQFTFDIYSNNISDADHKWLRSLENSNIHLHAGVPYDRLPDLLVGFDIGVILYKGHIPNYVHNAPNKMFEYMACGLDVWVPGTMTGCVPYHTNGAFPKVIPVDFTNLPFFNWHAAINRAGLNYSRPGYFYELEYDVIASRLFA